MALNNLGIGFVVTAKDMTTGTLTKVKYQLNSVERQAKESNRRMAQATRTAAVGFTALAAGAVGLRAMAKLAEDAGRFEMGMARVAGISNIATDSLEAQMLATTALGAAMKTKFSPDEATEGLANFAGAGFNAKAQADSLVPSLRLAQAGMISVADSSEAMVAAIKIFGIETDKAGLVTDKLLKISNLTNLQAKDLSLALGTVGRGAAAAGQNLDEMLISMGLVKNTGVDASVAASSVSSALLFMAKNAEKFKGTLGVNVTDANGKFRDFIDVAMEADAAMAGIKDQGERAALGMELFGKFGLTAFQAVTNQIKTGVETSTGEVLKGAQAVAYLRKQLQDAEGTAAVFEEKILGTFEGQKMLLQGVGEGLRVALGQPFLELMKPMVKLLVPLAERFVQFVQSLPPEFKRRLAGIGLAIVGVTIALGALLTTIAAVMAVGPMLAGALGPVALVLGGIAAAALSVVSVVKLFRFAAAENLGSVGAHFADLGNNIKLFFRAVGQLLSRGHLEGDVLKTIIGEEYTTLRTFVGFVARVVARVRAFFAGIGEGFRSALRAAKPIWDTFSQSLYEFKAAILDLFASFSKSKTSVSTFTGAGQTLGKVLGNLVMRLVDVVGIVIRFSAGVIRGMGQVRNFLQPVFDMLRTMFVELGDAFVQVLTELGVLGEASSYNTGLWGKLGEVLAWVNSVVLVPLIIKVGLAVKGLTLLFRALAWGIGKAKSLGYWLLEAGKRVGRVFTEDIPRAARSLVATLASVWDQVTGGMSGMFASIKAEIERALDFLAEVAAKIPAKFRPDALNDFVASRTAGVGAQPGTVARSAIAQARSTFGPVASAALAARASAGQAVEAKSTGAARATAAQAGLGTALAKLVDTLNKKPGTGPGAVLPAIKLLIDGVEIASRVKEAEGKRSAIAFE